MMRARPNHRMGSQHKRPLFWWVTKNSNEVARYDIEFIDDEHISYVGQRRASSMRLAKGTRTAAISDRVLLGEVNFNRFMVFSSELNRK